MTIYDYRISSGATAAHGTGTLNVSAGSTALGGASTVFLTQLHVGDIIIAGGMILSVAAIISDTSLTLAIAATTNLSTSAFDYDPLNNLETLGLYPPKSTFTPWTESKDLGNGLARSFGRPSTVWSWGFTRWHTTSASTHRDVLRTYCTGKSARVYIRTRKNDNADAYVTCSAVMLWPDGSEDRQASRRLNFVIAFRDLVSL